MKGHLKKGNAIFFLLFFVIVAINAQIKTLDEFESNDGWTLISPME